MRETSTTYFLEVQTMNEMNEKAKVELMRRQLLIGRVKKMLEKGLTVSEICEHLNIPESEIRPAIEVIEKAEKNSKLMEAANE